MSRSTEILDAPVNKERYVFVGSKRKREDRLLR